MTEKEIKGVVIPILTPLKADETVDVQSLRRLVDYLIDNGVHGIWASGTTGEFGRWSRRWPRLWSGGRTIEPADEDCCRSVESQHHEEHEGHEGEAPGQNGRREIFPRASSIWSTCSAASWGVLSAASMISSGFSGGS